MRMLVFCLAGTLGCWLFVAGQQQEQTPPGIHKAQEVRKPADDLPPVFEPGLAKRHLDVARLKREAEELAKLAQGIPTEVDELKSGRLSRDLNERLKAIEKLSKQLRRELSP